MARAAGEGTVVIMDVGVSIASKPDSFQGACNAVQALCRQKVLFGKKNDAFGLVVFGTKETENSLAEDDQYQHISVLFDCQFPEPELLYHAENLKPGESPADLLDALVVGMDMVVRAEQANPKIKEKRLFLVTDGGMPLDSDGIEEITTGLKTHNIKLNIIGVGIGEEDHSHKTDVQKVNEALLESFVEDVDGAMFSAKESVDIVAEMMKKTVAPTTVSRSTLNFGREIKIPFWMYSKVQVATQSFKKLSSKALVDHRPATTQMQREYFSIDDPNTPLDVDARIQAYKYGRALIPITECDADAMKYKDDKQLTFLGFISTSKIPRESFMSKTNVVLPEPNNPAAEKSFSALVKAMIEADKYALARYVRINNGPPQFGLLVPHLTNTKAVLYYTALPYHEDVREYSFSSVISSETGGAPSESQLEAAEKLIESMDLTTAAIDADGDECEALRVRSTFNPYLARLYQCVCARALDPACPLPPLDPTIEKYVNPDKVIMQRAAPAFEAFHTAFPTQRVVKDEKKKRKWKEEAGDGEADLVATVDVSKKMKVDQATVAKAEQGLSALTTTAVTHIGTVTPAEDAVALLQLGKDTGLDNVEEVIGELCDVIMKLVENSVGDNAYEKAHNALLLLRKTALQEREIDLFNSWLNVVKSRFSAATAPHYAFWKRNILANAITLISSAEAAESPVSPEEAAEFLREQVAVSQPASYSAPVDEGSDSDLD